MDNDPVEIRSMEMIRRSQAGDPEAFARLFHQYKNLVYRTAVLVLDNAGEAEDALQEVFLQVYRSLASYQPTRGAFTTWLYRITMNHCLNRKRKRRIRFLSLAQLRPADTPSSPSPEEGLGEELAVRQAMRRLSEKLRAVVVLRYFAGMSYAEIGQTLDIPLGTVKSRLNLALKLMRKHLESSGAPLPLDVEVVK